MQSSANRAARSVLLLIVTLLASLGAACGGSMGPAYQSATPGPSIELASTPVASYDATTGKTTVVLDFLVRDGTGASVDLTTASLRRYVNGNPVDVESVLATKDTKVTSNLQLGILLDASYSMTTWQPPAFEPMKKAAYTMQQSIRTQFAAWGTFASTMGWFQDRYVCLPPLSVAMPDSAVLEIPKPEPGDSTRLFAATAQMIDRMKQVRDALPGLTASDHFALVVFTDGYDNYSFFDAAAAPPLTVPVTGGSFACSGSGPTTLQDVLKRLQDFPDLKVHVIGLGNQIRSSELQAMASAGHGRFVSNPDPAQVSNLFGEVSREFTTTRRDGITMPLAAGDYEYVEEVQFNGTARVRFRFHAGDSSASVDARSITIE